MNIINRHVIFFLFASMLVGGKRTDKEGPHTRGAHHSHTNPVDTTVRGLSGPEYGIRDLKPAKSKSKGKKDCEDGLLVGWHFKVNHEMPLDGIFTYVKLANTPGGEYILGLNRMGSEHVMWDETREIKYEICLKVDNTYEIVVGNPNVGNIFKDEGFEKFEVKIEGNNIAYDVDDKLKIYAEDVGPGMAGNVCQVRLSATMGVNTQVSCEDLAPVGKGRTRHLEFPHPKQPKASGSTTAASRNLRKKSYCAGLHAEWQLHVDNGFEICTSQVVSADDGTVIAGLNPEQSQYVSEEQNELYLDVCLDSLGLYELNVGCTDTGNFLQTVTLDIAGAVDGPKNLELSLPDENICLIPFAAEGGIGEALCSSTGDTNAPKCIDMSEYPAPMGFHGTVTDELLIDSGVNSVVLAEGSTNLDMVVDVFTPGAGSVSFDATRIDDSQPASGIVIAADIAGNTCQFNIALAPFDFEIYYSLLNFPSEAHEILFGSSGLEEIYFYSSAELVEAVQDGYSARYMDSSFSIDINSIEVTSEVMAPLIRETTTPDFSVFVFRGWLNGPTGRSVEVVAVAFTYDGIEPPGYQILVIYDPSDPEFGLTDENDDLPPIDPPFRRALSSALPTSDDVSKQRELRHGRFLVSGCPSAMTAAIFNFGCRPPNKLRQGSSCVREKVDNFRNYVGEVIEASAALEELIRKHYRRAVSILHAQVVKLVGKATADCSEFFDEGTGKYNSCVSGFLTVIAREKASKLTELRKQRDDLIKLENDRDSYDVQAKCDDLKRDLENCLYCLYEPCEISSDCDAEEYPDPHFRTWNRARYDFHGACDAVYVHNSLLDIHIRMVRRGYWSAVSNAAIAIGGQIVEVDKDGSLWIDKEPLLALPPSFKISGIYPLSQSGNKIRVDLSGGQFVEFVRYYSSLLVRINGHGSDFFDSVGMAGTWNQFGLIGRDGTTIIDDTTDFAVEWEVSASDPQLFRTPSSVSCADPPEEARPVTPELQQAAEEACANLLEGEPERESCLFDVIASGGDTSLADNPAYIDPLVAGTTKCIDVTGGVASDECAALGGQCVWRCSSEVYTCRTDLCSEENGSTIRVLHDPNHRRMNTFEEGCACALPKYSKSSKKISKKKSKKDKGRRL